MIYNTYSNPARQGNPLANHLFVFNLAIADLMMGSYLLILAAHIHIFSGHYSEYELGWRSGVACRVMGVLVVLSSESSVFTMVALVCLRMYLLYKVSHFLHSVLQVE